MSGTGRAQRAGVAGAAAALLEGWLAARLAPRASEWLAGARAELAAGAPPARLAELMSLASRAAPRAKLAPSTGERAAASRALPGWNPERWTVLEAMRVALVLASLRSERGAEPAIEPAALEECFRFADEGEACALYRALQFLPDGGRFAARAGEGCRTNMSTVFQAVACDSAYPAAHLGDVAWRQLCIKAVFVGAPLWRVHGLDGRLDAELARMALDLVDERRSAGRPVPPELWLCLGAHGGARGLAALERELAVADPRAKHAALLALARAGERGRIESLARQGGELADLARRALASGTGQESFRILRDDEAS